MQAVLSLENISQTFFQGFHVLTLFKNLSLSFQQGSSYAITGISGSGKSTLLTLLSGFEKPTQGHVRFNGHDLHTFSEEQLQQFWLSSIGFLFQSPYLNPEFTVLENVILKGLIAQQPVNETKEKGLHLLNRLKLADKAYSSPTFLSGGEQQRVALLRAIFLNPAFLIADEPTAHLDEETKMSLIEVIQEYQQEQGMGLIISSHDAHLVKNMQYLYHLHDGILEKITQ